MTMCINNNGWFEIIEPKTKRKVFVNTATGKCQWNPPEKFQHLSENQWWELYDFRTCHLYYYNVKTMETSWSQPSTSNLVSLVKLQVLKSSKNKLYADKDTQTFQENVEELLNQALILECDESALSLNNTDTSGYNTYNSNYTSCKNGHCIQNVSNDSLDTNDYKDMSSTLPTTRKFIPRTNPNCTRHSQTLRLSQPIIGLHENIDFDVNLSNQNVYTSSKNVDEHENKEIASLMSLTVNKIPINIFENSCFPRNSVINAIDRGMITNMEIWSRNLFNKSDSQLAGLMSWTSKSISDSLLSLTPKAQKRKACENFKYIQMYMGDRYSKSTKETIALTICQTGISNSHWANEVFMQLCKQVTYNPNNERTFYGWELICICLKFFHPESVEMQSCFKSFLIQYGCFNQILDMENLKPDDYKSRSIFCARISLKLLDMSSKVTSITVEDIIEAQKSYGCLTMFFSSLEEVMQLQKRLFPDRKLPWIQVALSEEIFRCDGCRTQGIFRIPSEVNKIDSVTQAIEKAFKPNFNCDIQNFSSSDGCDPLLNKIFTDLEMDHDPLLLSSVLKNWFRHLHTPLLYFEDCDEPLSVIAKDYSKILRKINSLPEMNYLVVKHLIHFLQILGRPDNVPFTNMPIENLVTLMAPTLFKSDIQVLQPAMHLLQSLIMNWDTSDMENIR